MLLALVVAWSVRETLVPRDTSARRRLPAPAVPSRPAAPRRAGDRTAGRLRLRLPRQRDRGRAGADRLPGRPGRADRAAGRGHPGRRQPRGAAAGPAGSAHRTRGRRLRSRRLRRHRARGRRPGAAAPRRTGRDRPRRRGRPRPRQRPGAAAHRRVRGPAGDRLGGVPRRAPTSASASRCSWPRWPRSPTSPSGWACSPWRARSWPGSRPAPACNGAPGARSAAGRRAGTGRRGVRRSERYGARTA